jgi:phosphoglycolate phosphatase-like HAD superfamily hydrolase
LRYAEPFFIGFGASLKLELQQYKTIVFDSDGVVLNSNQTKIDAYFETAKKLGGSDEQAQALVDYHIALGGISRYVKFEYYLKEVLHQAATEAAIQQYLDVFGNILDTTMMTCEVAPSLLALKQATPEATWILLSGGDQIELRTIFKRRKLDGLFNGGIFGSPDDKDKVLAREKANGNLQFPALFLGDSRYDHQAATRAGLDFIFLSAWTDVPNWQVYCAENKVSVLSNISQLLTQSSLK